MNKYIINNSTGEEKSAHSSWHNSSLFDWLQQVTQFLILLLNMKQKKSKYKVEVDASWLQTQAKSFA